MAGNTERQLIKDVQKLGWVALRAPASGAGGDSDTGDVWVARLASNDELTPLTELYIIEEKYSGQRFISEDGEKMDRMIEVAEKIGAKPLMAVKYDGRKNLTPDPTHYIVDAREIERTGEGNVSIKHTQASTKFKTVEEYFGEENGILSDDHIRDYIDSWGEGIGTVEQ